MFAVGATWIAWTLTHSSAGIACIVLAESVPFMAWGALQRRLTLRVSAKSPPTGGVISDAHTGLKASIGSVFLGSAWQRCRVHFMRNILAVVPKGNQEMVAAAIRTIFAQPDAEHVTEQFEVIATMLGKQLPKVEQMLREARDDLLAFAGFPVAHWKKIWSTNPLERLNKEVKRRTDVVGVFPNPAALLRLAGAVLVEAHDEWQVSAERRYLSERSMALVASRSDEEVAKPELMTA
jgi:putative transposase